MKGARAILTRWCAGSSRRRLRAPGSGAPPLRLRLLVGVLALVVTSACGVPTEDRPDRLSASDLVSAGDPTPITAMPLPSGDPATADEARVYLLQGGRLVGVTRSVSNADLAGPVLDALLAGPTRAESDASITTAVPVGTASLDVTVIGRGTAFVAVPPRFEALALSAQILVVAQLAYTLTGIGGITGLQMTDGDEVVDIPNGDGVLTAGPVNRSTYPSLAPVGSTAAPTTSPTG